eukprot:5632236-Pyramimonas_sp.AAC.3
MREMHLSSISTRVAKRCCSYCKCWTSGVLSAPLPLSAQEDPYDEVTLPGVLSAPLPLSAQEDP